MKYCLHFAVDFVAWLRYVRAGHWFDLTFVRYRNHTAACRARGLAPYKPGSWCAYLGGNL